MSAHCSVEVLAHARKEGADGFISKKAAPLDYELAITTLHRGEQFWPPPPQEPSFADVARERLTEKQFPVWEFMAQQFGTKEIAVRLFRNERTVQHCRDEINRKILEWELEQERKWSY
jgi:DNA-binding NarL/FixJ family response regulator